MRANPVILAAAVSIGVAAPVAGHHSSSIFDRSSVVIIDGTVTRFDWRNPHVYIWVESAGENGEAREWLIETDPTPILTRSGWDRNSFAAGDSVTVRAHPERNGQTDHVFLVSIANNEDGRVLVPVAPESSNARTGVRATSLAGVWDAMPRFDQRRFEYGALTEKGAAAQAEYTESDNPVAECVPFPSPTIMIVPYLSEIELGDDAIVIRNEAFSVERTIHMDGRGHPETGERTNQGHSIGWWEGEVLVVDTTRFADYRNGNRAGIPSGAGKHVVERYTPSEDGTRVLVEFEVEDPEYLAEPMRGSTEWTYAPHLEMLPSGCDPESARRYTLQ